MIEQFKNIIQDQCEVALTLEILGDMQQGVHYKFFPANPQAFLCSVFELFLAFQCLATKKGSTRLNNIQVWAVCMF